MNRTTENGKLEHGVVGYPGITLHLGSGKRGLTTPALVDKGASISVISQDLAHRIFSQDGCLYLLIRANRNITSASGHGLQLCGTMETKVSGVGVVSFHVIMNLLSHHCVIGGTF